MSDSGSGDNIDVRVTAQVDDAVNGFNTAAQSTKVLETSVKELAAVYPNLERNLNAAASAFKNSATASQQAAQATKQAGQAAASTAVDYKSLIENTTGLNSQFRSAAESAKAFQAALDPTPAQNLKNAFKELGEAGGKAGQGAHLGATGMREVIVIGHEFVTGNWTRIPSSLMVLAERFSGLGSIAASITPQIAAFATVGVAAFGAIAYAGYQAYERFTAIRDVAGSLAIQGFGNQQGNVTQEFDQIKELTSASNGAIKTLEEELNKLPAAAQSSRMAFVQMATSIAALKHEKPEKVLEEFVSAARSGPEALAKLITQIYGLESGIKGINLQEIVRTSTNLEEVFQKLAQAGVSQEVTKIGAESGKASNELMLFALAAASVNETGNASVLMMEKFGENVQKVIDPLKGATLEAYNLQNELGALAAQSSAVLAGNTAFDRRKKILQEVKDAQAAVDRINTERPHEGTAARDNSALAQRKQDAVNNLQIEAQKVHTPKEEQDFAIVKQESEKQLNLWKNDQDKKIQILQEAADKAKQYYGAGTPEAIAAQNRVTEAEQEQSRKRVQVAIDEAKDKAAEDRRGGEARIAELQRVADLMRNAKGKEGEPLYNPEQIASADRAVTTQKRLELDRQYRDFKVARELEIQEAKGAVDRINALFKQIQTKAKATNQPDSEIDSVEKQRVAAVQRAQAEQVNDIIKFNNAQNQLDQAKIATNAAQLKIEVLNHQISKEQEAQAEQTLTAKIFAEEEKRLAEIIRTTDLTREQRIKLNTELEELYTKDLEKQIQAQEKITQAVEAENAKRKKSFDAVFDSAGSALERFLTAGITKSSTFAKASQQLFQSIAGSVVKEAGSLASDYAGKASGPSLGLSNEQSKGGLGSVLGSALMKSLGLMKDTPKTGMEGVSEKISLAAKAQEEAAKAMNQLTASLQKAAPNGVPGATKSNTTEDASLQSNTAAVERHTAVTQQAIQSTSTAAQSSTQVNQSTQQDVQAVTDNSLAVKQLAQIIQSEKMGAVPAGSAASFAKSNNLPYSGGDNSSSSSSGGGGVVSGATGLLGAVGRFVPGAGQLGGFISSIQGAVSSIKTLSSAISPTVSGITNLTGSLSPAASAASSIGTALTTTNTAVTATGTATTALQGANVLNTAATATNTVATTANSAAQGGGGIGSAFGGIIGAAGVAAFKGGGIVSAAGGMMVGSDGQLAVLHNKEMVLPADISGGLQDLIAGGGKNSGGNTLNYNANVTGYHPYQSASQFDSLMRMHGSSLMNHATNALRNGWKA